MNSRPCSPAGWFIGADHIGEYMHRWYFRTPWGAIRLHHILRSDQAEALHDHPWDFCSFLLSGGYTEVRPDGAVYHPQGSVVRRRAEDLHRLIIWRPVWTLVFTGPRRRTWGFQTETGWVPWAEALGGGSS